MFKSSFPITRLIPLDQRIPRHKNSRSRRTSYTRISIPQSIQHTPLGRILPPMRRTIKHTIMSPPLHHKIHPRTRSRHPNPHPTLLLHLKKLFIPLLRLHPHRNTPFRKNISQSLFNLCSKLRCRSYNPWVRLECEKSLDRRRRRSSTQRLFLTQPRTIKPRQSLVRSL